MQMDLLVFDFIKDFVYLLYLLLAFHEALILEV